MKIMILGAGRIGESVAESLVSEQNDITVVDTDPKRLALLQDRLDLRGVVGNGVLPAVMKDAGAEDTDLLIACAPMDETNMVACKVAHDVFNVPTRIARIRSADFSDDSGLMGKQGFAIDATICPEESLTTYIRKLIEYPEALQVLEFSQKQASLVAVRAMAGGRLVGHVISELSQLAPGVPMRIVAIYRRDPMGSERQVTCDGSTRVELGDEVFVLAANQHIRAALDALHQRDDPVKRIMIAGGGRVGLRLARHIGTDCQVKIIESSAERCEYLTTQLPDRTLILRGDSTDEDLLEAENVQDTDLYLALTNDDEDNIMSCLLAKRMGAKRVLALINRRAYADLVQGTGTEIDIAVSPAQTVIGELLAHVRRGDVAAVYSLRGGASEVLEVIVRGDRKSSRVVGRRIEELPRPGDAAIGAIVRTVTDGNGHERKDVLIPHHDTVIESGDHVIIFVPRKRMVRQIEKLFQVSATFF
ncbi:MAG: Trk system potassium transporter TrkA [Burkholderiaceae bacterium]|jgi:trk system potassium uptake protein TrkA|nr:Trk system potassium transporter TrkA [Burkholderiaceae bacterium]